MKSIKHFLYLLPPLFKKRLTILIIFLFFGMLLEMLGLGMLIPALSLMTDTEVVNKYPVLNSISNSIGYTTQKQLLFFGFSLLIIVYLIKSVVLGFLYYRQSKFNADLSAEFSDILFRGYLNQSYSFHLERNSSQLLKNIQGEVTQLNGVLQAFGALLLEVSMIIGIIIVLISIEPYGAISVIVVLAFSSILFHILSKNQILNWGQARQFHDGRINQHLMQGLGGIKDVKMMGKENYFLEKFRQHNNGKAKAVTKIVSIGLMPRLYLEFLSVLGLSVLILVMVAQNKSIELLIPIIAVFVAAAFRLIPSANRILTSVQAFKFAGPVLEVLYNEFKIINSAEKVTNISRSNLSFKHEINLTNIDYKYPNSNSKAIQKVNVCIKRGESVGFVGPSGSGKSTLLDVILGLLHPINGEITVDGMNINSNLRMWQDQIGYIPQSIYLTDDTIKRNVAFGISDKYINMDKVINALKAAQLDDFVNSLPSGIETFVGERGVRLSGGQRQRIGIARALYHDPQVLVLDEATSALDTETEKEVMKAVNVLQGNKTLIIVAHRLSTIEHCNRVFELKKGQIVSVKDSK
uniref:ABC transporter ATP-binding protein n=1 Tax=Algoriphagus sp. TaxID=1872435 RepID=UPI004048151D